MLMRRIVRGLGVAVLTVGGLVGCDDGVATDAGTDAGMPDAGPDCTEVVWTPDAPTLWRWPEPTLAMSDPTTETGIRLHFEESRYMELTNRLRGYRQVFTEDLGELDGFGTNAEAFFSFNRAFDEAALPDLDEEIGNQPYGFVAFHPSSGGGRPTTETFRVVFDTTDDGQTLLLAPARPLPEDTLVAVYVTTAAAPATGGCLRPSEAFTAALAAADADTELAIGELTRSGVISGAADLAALTVFHTQSIAPDAVAVADDIAARGAPSFVAPPSCVDETTWIKCTGSIVSQDYRDADGVFRRDAGQAATPVGTYELPITFWLPPASAGPGPHPTLFYGHGLGSGSEQAQRLADFAAPLGMVTVSASALMHGDHPTNPDPDTATLQVVLNFFAVGDLNDRALHSTRLRENFRQTDWDRLQVTTLLETSPDIDGDGTPDVDGTHLAYLGVSLGGLMGPQLLATTDAYGAGVLAVPGGRVSTIISDSALFSALIDLLRPPGTSPGDVRRFFPVLQTVLDAGDPASFGPNLLGQRLGALTRTPDILVGVVLDDDTVPNIANYTIGRAIGVPIIAPVRRPEPGFEVQTGPVSGNFGTATGGLVQFDYVRDDPMSEVRMATHSNVGDSDVGAEAWFDFLDTHFSGSTRIRDPYEAIGFPRP
ncbi:MAG: hypothetical protein AB7S26_06370 [Sandaracinaceae bacterium]